MRIIKTLVVVCLLLFSLSLSANEVDNSFDLNLEELLGVEVTSVSKQRQPLSDSPAAIYVVSNKDIVSSGATSIPQALRGVPGLHVAQIDSQKWAVSSRGFNGRFNNKLLVLMDGRAIYSPLFSGVYWEAQDTLMSDIDRIEIIRGPSAAIWGANAVNGVINIITKHSADTIGGYAELGVGDYEQGFAGFRYGAKLGDGITARAYAKGFERDSLEHNGQDMNPIQHMLMTGVNTDNGWRQQQAGGRIDMKLDQSATLSLSADIYRGEINQLSFKPILTPFYTEYSVDNFNSSGWNVLANYTKALSATSEYNLKVYFDHTKREESFVEASIDTIDIDFQHQFNAWQRHNVVWGLGYRFIENDLEGSSSIDVSEVSKNRTLWSGFIRDEITLSENALWLTLATRVEHNSYTGMEWQPNARLVWKLSDQHKLWSSVAYSVRTPSQAEDATGINIAVVPPVPAPFPTEIVLHGDEQYESEELLAYEVGYRFSPTDRISVDATVFYNKYDKLRSTSTGAFVGPEILPVPHFTQFLQVGNDADGHSYGLEISNQWVASEKLKFKLNYGFIQSDFSEGQTQNTEAPKHIASLSAEWLMHQDVDINMMWRYVDEAAILDIAAGGSETIDAYHGVDIGVTWRVLPKVSLSAFGKNLFYGDHVEYKPELFHIPYRVEPSFYGKVTIDF
ncbi:MAG: TonB-dependent receptor [Cycloclasticus sp.]|nr:TonB-dependent receptor [Cycloclasticus sp.]